MVYTFIKQCFIKITVLFLTFYTLIGKYTLYFSYVVSLNFWDTNVLIVIVFVCLYLSLSTRYFIFFSIFLFFLKTSNFVCLPVFRTLMVTLIIGTVTLHPFAFYLCVAIFLIKMLNANRYMILNQILLLDKTTAYLLFITLFLGGLWSTQSSAWGYFWVNDLIEWSLTFFIIYLLILLHFFFINVKVVNFYFIPLTLINILVGLRFGLFSTRHNFIAAQSTFISLITIYIYIFFIFTKQIHFVNQWNFSQFFKKKLPLLPLLSLPKYLFFITSIAFYNNKVSKYVKYIYIHTLIIMFFFIWLVFFNFFFLNYSLEPNISFDLPVVFDTFINFVFNYKISQQQFFLLDIITYSGDRFFKSTAMFLFDVNARILLNNSHLIYILTFIFFKIVWI